MPKGSKTEEARSFGMLERYPESEADPAPEEAEGVKEEGVLFYVNKDGFPIGEATWKRMWRYAAKLHPEGKNMVNKIRGGNNLPEIPTPQAPVPFPLNTSIPERLDMVQKYMSELQYNHTGTQFFDIRKNRPLSGLMDVARDMIRDSLPIKCLEAVILAIHLTNGMVGVDRFPVSFKTTFTGHTHRHVVLGVYYDGKYGAMGMSRRQDLMYKPLQFKNLSEMILDFVSCYKQYSHGVKKVKIGLPVHHDPHSFEPIVWKSLTVSLPDMTREEMSRSLERHAREMRGQLRSLTSIVDKPSKKSSSHSGAHSVPGTPLNNPQSSHKTHKSKKTKAERHSHSHSQGHIVQHSAAADTLKQEDTSTPGGGEPSTQYQIRI